MRRGAHWPALLLALAAPGCQSLGLMRPGSPLDRNAPPALGSLTTPPPDSSSDAGEAPVPLALAIAPPALPADAEATAAPRSPAPLAASPAPTAIPEASAAEALRDPVVTAAALTGAPATPPAPVPPRLTPVPTTAPEPAPAEPPAPEPEPAPLAPVAVATSEPAAVAAPRTEAPPAIPHLTPVPDPTPAPPLGEPEIDLPPPPATRDASVERAAALAPAATPVDVVPGRLPAARGGDDRSSPPPGIGAPESRPVDPEPPARPAAPGSGRTVATVGPRAITLGELTEAVQARLAGLPEGQRPTRRQIITLARGTLQGLIEDALVRQEARARLGDDAAVAELVARIDARWDDQELRRCLAREGVSDAPALAARLASRGQSIEALRESYRNRALAAELMRREGRGGTYEGFLEGLRERYPITSVMSPNEIAAAAGDPKARRRQGD